jgi:tetratricopeptide (TPR) repeat protein
MKMRLFLTVILLAIAAPALADRKEYFVQAFHAARATETETPAPPLQKSLPDALLSEGMDYFQARRYENALEKLSLFLSLYPKHGKVSSAMLAIGQILIQTKRPMSAIRFYSRILDRYPETPQVIETMTALADMSMLSPGLKPNIALSGAKWYLDPVDAYDAVLSKDPSPELTERLLLQRIAALRSQGRFREAYTAGGQYLENNPDTIQRHILLTGLRADVAHLIGERFTAGDDIALINLLANARRRNLISLGDTDIMMKAADSYARSGMTDEARTLLDRAKRFAVGRADHIDAALRDLTKDKRAFQNPSSVVERWALYEKGRRELQSSNLSAAEKTLAQLKGADQDEFWSKLADFTLQDRILKTKYKDYLEK